MHCLRRCFGKFHPTESLNLPAFSVVWYSSSIDRTNEYNDKKFVDRLVVTARAGHGGQGCASFVKRRSKNRKLLPDGGDGGPGGDVVLQACKDMKSLAGMPQLLTSSNGRNGMSKRQHGKKGQDGVYKVPLGTSVRALREKISVKAIHNVMDGHVGAENHHVGEYGDEFPLCINLEEDGSSESDEHMAELNEERQIHEDPAFEEIGDLINDGDCIAVARGGIGGKGNSNLVSKRHRACHAELRSSTTGESVRLILEMKIVSDFSLVGFPNVGKSSLLRAISNAIPRVDDFAFTTVNPQLGSVKLGYSQFIVSDVPGLIEGAHENRGIGHKFLRHVERSKIIVHVLDSSGAASFGVGVTGHARESSQRLRPEDQLMLLRQEIGLYSSKMLEKPFIVVLNKIDLLESEDFCPRDFQEWVAAHLGVTCVPVIPVSATGGKVKKPKNVDELIKEMDKLIN